MNSDELNNRIRAYRVSKDEYFANLESYIKESGLNPQLAYSYIESKESCEKPMNSLIGKYNLSDMQVFSLGPSFGHEEYWFYKNGCNLTFLDIDESKVIESFLKTLQSSSDNGLTYFIGDAFTYLREDYSECKYDVFYVSSFTPDELRRGDIQAKNATLYKKAVNRLAYKIFKRRPFKTWPQTANPYMDLLMDLVSTNLKEGGLFISQSYAYGVDVKSNPHFVKLVESQLKKNSIILLKIYCLKAIPQDTLTIGFKGKEANALSYLKEIGKNKDIVSFHCRHPASKSGCEIVYENETMHSYL